MQLVEASTGKLIVERLEVADGIWSRFWGLQFRRSLEPGSGLLLIPCPSIHTCWLRFAIDVVFLNRQGGVVSISPTVRPWRVAAGSAGAYAALELPAGSNFLQVGAVVRLEAAGAMRRSLRFLASGDSIRS